MPGSRVRDLDWLVSRHANLRISEAVAKTLGVPMGLVSLAE